MAVISVVGFAVRSGRMDDLVAGVKELKPIVERLGVNLKEVRVFQNLVGGQSSGTVAVTFEYADLASWGATNDRELQDPAWLAVVARLSGPDASATVVSRELYTEIVL
jgi:hypothetical protein